MPRKRDQKVRKDQGLRKAPSPNGDPEEDQEQKKDPKVCMGVPRKKAGKDQEVPQKRAQEPAAKNHQDVSPVADPRNYMVVPKNIDQSLDQKESQGKDLQVPAVQGRAQGKVPGRAPKNQKDLVAVREKCPKQPKKHQLRSES